jgi:iron-sulfur cluster protein
MYTAKNMKEYRAQVKGALDNEFQRQALDKFAVAYQDMRARAFAGLDLDGLIAEIAAGKDEALGRMDELFDQFRREAESRGVKVHLASDADEANRIISGIAEAAGAKRVIKTKSMTAEETLLAHHLEDKGMEVTETDLGEWIIQLRGEGPSHMVLPAIHLSRYQVRDLFSQVTRQEQDAEIDRLVKVARRELRARFVEADMGISGANFAVAENGAIATVTNEGNARLVMTLPRIHVALIGLDKLVPTLHDALRIIRVLPRNATGQAISSYVTWVNGVVEWNGADGSKETHFVFLDNGRRALAKDPTFRQVLRCVRCGACANVCPVYRMVGGHQYGHIYIGAIGLILTYFFHGREKARNLVANCINCGACKSVCAAGIDLPRLIKEILTRIQDESGHPIKSALLGRVLQNRRLFHGLLRSAKAMQRPITGGTPYLRHLPHIFARDQEFRALPALADKPFRDRWPEIRPRTTSPQVRAGLFAGCALDFIYPDHLEAGGRVMAKAGVDLDFPMDQTCCGLPVLMMGEKAAARMVAAKNVTAFDPGRYDYIVTLCASCASHMKHQYVDLLSYRPDLADKARIFTDRVIDFSSFAHDVLNLDIDRFAGSGVKAAYHAPCHLCRGLGVKEAPRKLIEAAGLEYVQTPEEEVCCGFGGTYSVNFPEISAEILKSKLKNVSQSGAEVLVTDCPGCVMQLRGGVARQGGALLVKHMAEVLAEAMKQEE